MIQIKSVTLYNICQFSSFSASFKTGMTRVYGPNGCGKSNLFRAIVYGLTGSTGSAWGTQSDLQKDDEVMPGYVELEITN